MPAWSAAGPMPCGIFAMSAVSPKSPSAAIVLTAGALFGIAAYHAIASSGVPLADLPRGSSASALAQFRPALAWWTWMLLPAAAFVLGRAGAEAARLVLRQGATFRLLRFAVMAGITGGLAWIGGLPASPATAGQGTLATVLFIGVSALFAALGQRFMPGQTHGRAVPREQQATPSVARRAGGRGSIHPRLVPPPVWAASLAFRRGRRPAVSLVRLAVLFFATSLGACGGAVLVLKAQPIDHGAIDVAPGGAAQASVRARLIAAPQPAAVQADRAIPGPVQLTATARAFGKADERELTFTGGYAARQAARAAAADAAATDIGADARSPRASPHSGVEDPPLRSRHSRRRHRHGSS